MPAGLRRMRKFDLYRATRRWALPAAVFAALLVLATSTATACPMCKDTLATSEGGDVVAGYFWSILFMMAMPFTILGSLSGVMYYEVRKARAGTEPEVPHDADAAP